MTNLSRLEIRALQVFEAVAAEGSISGAAVRLGVTQSAVSQTIAQVEEVLGTKVLDRSHRPVRLTSAGIALRRDAHSVVEEMNRLIANVKEADVASRPEIRIGMIDSYAATVGPSVVKEAIRQGHQVVLWGGLAYRHTQGMLQRQLDLIVTSDALEDMDGLVRRPLFTEPFMIVLPAGRKAMIQEGNIAEIARTLPLVRFSTTSHYGALTERYFRRYGIKAGRYLEIDTADVLLSMVAADLGWAVISPLGLLQAKSHMKDVCVLPISGPKLSRTIYQVSRAGEYQETAKYFYQTSRRVLDTVIIPELKELLPDPRLRIQLS